MAIAKDLAGRTFGKLTVIERAPNPSSNRAHWLCRCECGQTAVKNGKYLLCGDTNSCGCDQLASRARGNPSQGNARNLHKAEYTIWRSMKSRCYVTSASNYRFYGAIGVTICDRWRDDFTAFLSDMGPCPDGQTIDRKDSKGHYEPSNCRWSTWDDQHNNTRRNVFVAVEGELMTLARASRLVGVGYQPLYHRMKRFNESFDAAVEHLRQLSSPR